MKNIKKIKLKFANNISICHLYHKENTLKNIDSFSEKFYNFEIIDIDRFESISSKINIFIIEINNLEKKILKKIQKIVASYTISHIYLFSNIYNTPLMLKFALNLGAKNIFSSEQDEKFIVDFLNIAIKKVIFDIHYHNLSYLGEQIDKNFPVLVLIKQELTFANSSAKKFFNNKNIDKIESYIKKNKDLSNIIDRKISINIILNIENAEEEHNKQFCSFIYYPYEDKTILSILVNRNEIDGEIDKLIQSRFAFLERLKDKIIQNNLNNKEIFLTLISIDNGKKIEENYLKTEYYNFLKKFISAIDNFKNNSSKIIEWNSNLFILMYENVNFLEMKNDIALLHNNIIKNQKNNKFAPIITTSFFSIVSKDLNAVIEFINKIDKQDLTLNEAVKENYYEFKHLNDTLDENEQITHLLHNCINNNITVKLLNIYKGLCVNTESKVLKQTNEFFYLSCEKLQRYIVKIDRETIIQSPIFPHDIKAVVKFIDINKSYIILEKFKFMYNSANSRQHTRVQPTVRTPIVIKKDKFVKYGEVLDISINSIAIKIKQVIDNSLVGSKVNLSFKLPNDKREDGFSPIDIDAEVKMVFLFEDFSKIVLMMNESDGTDASILRYIYLRQKELIFELRKAIKFG